MSVLPSDVVVYGSANMPETDGATIGGAVDFTRRVAFYGVTPAGNVDVISSSSADTTTKIVYSGRDSTGAIQSQTLTLNGQSWVIGSQSLERLLYAALSGASANGPLANPGGTPAVGDVALAAHSCVLPSGALTTDATVRTAQAGSANHSGTTPPLFKLQSGDGGVVSVGQIIWTKSGTGANQLRQIIATAGYGTDMVAISRDWGTVPDNTTTYKILQGMLFELAQPGNGSDPHVLHQCGRYACRGAAHLLRKGFRCEQQRRDALTGAQIEVASETPALPSGALMDLALTTALNDTGTVANRQTAPASGVGSFTTQPAFLNVPSPGNLPSGAAPNAAGAQGVWLRLTLPAGTIAYKGSADLRTQGTTT